MRGVAVPCVVWLGLLALGCSSGEAVPDRGEGACGPLPSCDDADPCTIDSCVNDQCRHVGRSCDDNDPCTTDSCMGGKCVNVVVEGCCSKDAQCDDKDICTTDTCTPDGCRHAIPDPTCCSVPSDCDDLDECTIDECVENRCRHTWMKSGNCCKNDNDCLEGIACTDDRCVEGKCVHENTGCCSFDDDCGDGNPCRIWRCEKKVCKYDVTPGCCQVDLDCADQNPCTIDTCKNGDCDHEKGTACCSSDADCKPEDPCRSGTCVIEAGAAKGDCVEKLVNSPECCKATLVEQSFSGGLGGILVEDLYPDSPGPVWNVDPAKGALAPPSLYCGDPATHTYESPGYAVGSRAVTPEVDLAKTMAPELRFSYFKETEVAVGSDLFSVSVISGGKEYQVWASSVSSTGGVFVPVTIGLSAYEGKKVRLAFVFDTGSQFANQLEGVYIDDIVVAGTCE